MNDARHHKSEKYYDRNARRIAPADVFGFQLTHKIVYHREMPRAQNKFYAIACAAGGERSYLATMHLTQICMNQWRMIQLPRILYATKNDFKKNQITNKELIKRINNFSDEFINIGRKLLN